MRRYLLLYLLKRFNHAHRVLEDCERVGHVGFAVQIHIRRGSLLFGGGLVGLVILRHEQL